MMMCGKNIDPICIENIILKNNQSFYKLFNEMKHNYWDLMRNDGVYYENEILTGLTFNVSTTLKSLDHTFKDVESLLVE